MGDSTGQFTTDAPANGIGRNPHERRMQVRAYNYWANLLGNGPIPAITALNREKPGDFSANSILLDLSADPHNPDILHLGETLANECGIAQTVAQWSDIPARSLLAQIADRFPPLLAKRTPVSCEADFVNQRGQTILYRGILLPFSSDNHTVDFILCVINWKEAGEQGRPAPADENASARARQPFAPFPTDAPLTNWADGPAMDAAGDVQPPRPLDTSTSSQGELALAVVRKQADGSIALVGLVADEGALLEQAMRKLRD